MKITYEYMMAAPIGHHIIIKGQGPRKGPWVKLDLDHKGQMNSALQGELRPYWAHVETGKVEHFSWLVDSWVS